MADHILPFDIQAEIMKMLPIKSLIRFRSVSKQWLSLIDSSKFINNYHINRKHLQHRIFVQYKQENGQKYISIIDDSTFPNQKSSLPGPLSLLRETTLAHSSVNGLLCFYGVRRDVAGETKMAVLWNPTIRKSVGIPIPNALSSPKGDTYIGFGSCPDTSDPKLVRINTILGFMTVDWEVEVYTLSARIWKTVSNIPLAFNSYHLKGDQVFVGGFIYWPAFESIKLGGRSNLIVSFGLKNDEFGEVCLPDRLVHACNIGVTKVYESLGLLEFSVEETYDISCVVWVMKEGVAKSFTKMFSIKSPPADPADPLLDYIVLEFRNNGDAIVQDFSCFDHFESDEVYRSLLELYEPCSGHANGLGIIGKYNSFSVKSYMETLLLLDHFNSIIH
ncbi:putative F-box domain-containing protein [Tanacetum coccineum]